MVFTNELMIDVSAECADNQVIIIMIMQQLKMSVWWHIYLYVFRGVSMNAQRYKYIGSILIIIVHPYVAEIQ